MTALRLSLSSININKWNGTSMGLLSMNFMLIMISPEEKKCQFIKTDSVSYSKFPIYIYLNGCNTKELNAEWIVWLYRKNTTVKHVLVTIDVFI